ncbi:MAG: ATP-binding cassette domain-containing protein [Ornithinimicrobium sp.]|uniref:ABC transporter ATP-binding protein n=1 Tax=Ornithinimicrobium sp. TaxID=1977084 RepID=UPI0026DEBD9C|nr:ATP-binding cassette domain-containing protein [Ornithinimicrobium sp.]MDO5740585.1 ATP-binding cassette domain-containing protein [Ornithinimicrobium sp.]
MRAGMESAALKSAGGRPGHPASLSPSLDVHLVVDRGDFHLDLTLPALRGVTALLGPNGSGKTTALTAVAGLLRLTSGHVIASAATPAVWADASRGLHLPVDRRSVGMVLADPLLFPHLTLLDNVAYGPRSRGMTRRAARARASAELARVGLAELAGRAPDQVSSGQAQRAALARALATDPAVLLLDEPLSALDPQTRSTTRADLSARLREYAGVTVIVTHDALDALTLGDHLVFLEGGRAVQSGTPAEVIARPRSPYVAGIVGLNLLPGTLLPPQELQTSTSAAPPRVLDLGGGQRLVVADLPEGSRPGDAVFATINPEAVTLYTQRPAASARNLWQLEVGAVTVTGQRARVRCAFPGPTKAELVAEVTLRAVAELHIVAGQRLWASVKATEIHTYPA